MNTGLATGLKNPPSRRVVRRAPIADPRLQPPTQPSTQTIPPGMLMPSAAMVTPTTLPLGWLLCNGATVSKASYPALFQAIGYTYGADPGGGNFLLPNLKGKVIVGVDAAQTEFDVLGESGGAKTHALVVGEIPGHTHGYAHTHGMDTVSTRHAHNVYATGGIETWWQTADHAHNYDHWHLAVTSSMHWNATQTHGHHDRGGIASEAMWEGANWAGGTSVNVTGTGGGGTSGVWTNHKHDFNHSHPSTNYQDESPWGGGTATNHAHTTNTQSTSTSDNGTGGGGAHNNLQPYMALNYLIKT